MQAVLVVVHPQNVIATTARNGGYSERRFDIDRIVSATGIDGVRAQDRAGNIERISPCSEEHRELFDASEGNPCVHHSEPSDGIAVERTSSVCRVAAIIENQTVGAGAREQFQSTLYQGTKTSIAAYAVEAAPIPSDHVGLCTSVCRGNGQGVKARPQVQIHLIEIPVLNIPDA